jgi:hypothetical protein
MVGTVVMSYIHGVSCEQRLGPRSKQHTVEAVSRPVLLTITVGSGCGSHLDSSIEVIKAMSNWA